MLTYESSPELRAIADAAVRAQQTTQFPARIMLAVWACESAWGSKLTGDFNYWGITCDPTYRPSKCCTTHEDITPEQLAGFAPAERATAVRGADLGGGKYRYTMSRWFVSYPSIEESILAYTKFFTNSPQRYQAAWQQYLVNHDETALLTHICEAGYATGNAENTELALMAQSNIAHAIEMAERAVCPTPNCYMKVC